MSAFDLHFFDNLFKEVLELKGLVIEHISQKKETKENEWLTHDEAFRFLKVSTRTLHYYRKKGMINFSQPKGTNKIYYLRKDLDEFLMKDYVKN